MLRRSNAHVPNILFTSLSTDLLSAATSSKFILKCQATRTQICRGSRMHLQTAALAFPLQVTGAFS